MAVEAQVCPQCGATIQFAEDQTQVVCGHCGTTVVKPVAAGAPSVEKELAAEKLVQETVGREKKLHSHGRPATAKIITAQATDIFRQTVEGRAVLMSLAVEVEPEGEAPFSAAATVLVGLKAVDKYHAGTVLDVRYDPQDRAHVAVEGRHGVPSSNPEEQARQRHAKEQARRQAQLAQQAQPAQPNEPGPVKPAWGGPRPAGSVPVPVEFDKVTNLGPAASVHEHQGVRLLSNFGTPRANEVVRYRDGLAYRAHGADIAICRWDEVASIETNVSEGYKTAKQHEYTLTKHTGEKLILDDGVKGIEPLIEAVKQAVFALIEPPAQQHYQQGQAQTFGPVTVHQQNGLQLDGKLYAWDAIQDVKLSNGQFKVTLRTGQKHEARVSAIPNIEVLCQLIGMGVVYSSDMIHYG